MQSAEHYQIIKGGQHVETKPPSIYKWCDESPYFEVIRNLIPTPNDILNRHVTKIDNQRKE